MSTTLNKFDAFGKKSRLFEHLLAYMIQRLGRSPIRNIGNHAYRVICETLVLSRTERLEKEQ